MAGKRKAFKDITNTPQTPQTPRLIFVVKKPRLIQVEEPPEDTDHTEGPALLLDEESGLFVSSPLTSAPTLETPRLILPNKHHLIAEKNVNEAENLSSNDSLDGMILDETTGDFVESPSSNFTIPYDNTCAIIDRVLELEAIVARQKAELNRREGMLQQCEREILEEIIAEQEERMSQMTTDLHAAEEKIKRLEQELLDITGGEFGKKIDKYRKAEAKLNEKLQNLEKRLSPTQIKALQRNSTRGLVWGIGEIRDGLILKMKCGTSGYEAWVQYLPILPAVRTLQKNVQHVVFRPGMILHAVFDMLEVLGNVMPDIERDCQLVCDEMQLEPTPKFDLSLGEKVGDATLPGHEGKANKALLFLLAGITARWKLSVRVEFTNKKAEKYKNTNHTGIVYKEIIDEIILKCESVGLRVSNVTTDMGADNLACWRAYGITANKRSVCCSFQNPVRPEAQVIVLPDVVHVMKNTKAMLETNGTIELPSDVVKEAGLTSPIVDYKHIEDLHEYERDNELKVAFRRLREDNIHTKKHFKKMNVGTAKAVLCHRTGVGLKVLSEEKDDPSYNTTAWFILLLNTFFTLATARHKGLAISKENMGAFEKAVAIIKQVSYIFANMKVGNGDWKPVQRGVMVLCTGYLRCEIADRGPSNG
ncbi:uncharacterized protein LOC117651054 [Thrips palmi]|uniref:Uncharacterized protein LOC117651054 n=1 Tax=Thrips palmi TaxID=161013 RepID=A0A6P9A016_THRPL|nr:uncharacterized protein LOC117651054 [Thrips palmi]